MQVQYPLLDAGISSTPGVNLQVRNGKHTGKEKVVCCLHPGKEWGTPLLEPFKPHPNGI